MNCKQIMRSLERLGWHKVTNKTRGDHIKYRNEDGKTTVVPYKGTRQLANGTISAICKQTGLTKQTLLKNKN